MKSADRAAAVAAEWIVKAENDLLNATHTLTLGSRCPTDTVCFHAQQCAEKYLNALLQEAQIPFGKTHHLIALLELVLSSDQSWELFRPQLQSLNAYSVTVRYPGEAADKKTAREALGLAKTIRGEARQKFRMPCP
jgi:HEPN domain-containing protein